MLRTDTDNSTSEKKKKSLKIHILHSKTWVKMITYVFVIYIKNSVLIMNSKYL